MVHILLVRFKFYQIKTINPELIPSLNMAVKMLNVGIPQMYIILSLIPRSSFSLFMHINL